MNEKFREYVFGRAFNLQLRETHIELLAKLCGGDQIASYSGMAGSAEAGLFRRGLIELSFDDRGLRRIRPTKAGMLVYDLLVEAGEYAAMEETKRKTLEAEDQLHKLEWDERFGKVQVTLKERFLKGGAPKAQDN